MSAPVAAQERVAALMSVPGPKLQFSAAQMDLARAVAGDSDLAAFYGGNGLAPVFIGQRDRPFFFAFFGSQLLRNSSLRCGPS